MAEEYDLVVIGAGSAGLTAAGFAVQLGARVALVEKHRIGGDCTWTGCVPSKTLLKIAKVAHEMRNGDRYGLIPVDVAVDLKAVMSVVHNVINQVYQHESPEALRANGIDVLLGNVHFLDPHTLSVNENTIKARHFLLSTGAHSFVPPIDGLDSFNYLTYENIWDLEVLPEHLLVIGAGPIGCEIAQAFRRLGSRVTVIEGGERMLPRDESDASQVMAEVFSNEGIDLNFNVKVDRVWQKEKAIHVAAAEEGFVGDALLVAVGRRPDVDGLALEKAGVNYSPRGIDVDEHLRTSQRHIYAAGDCIGSYQFTHYAGWQAAMAVRNALIPGTARGIRDAVPWATFTDPEVAHVGLAEQQARERYGNVVMTCDWPMERVDRARAEGDTAGFLKLVHKKDGTLLGATIVCSRAGEMIHEWIVALEQGLKVGDLAQVIHVYPTYSTASMQAAADIRVAQLLGGTSGKIIRRVAHLIR
jgi:pyruvate/2-oxoglutarate dehydrogenase complex dihydrolipoamide dehydrogenase (E3) component